MARDSLSKYVKKPTARMRSISQKSGSWIANAMKSVGYSTFDVLQELMPSTIDVAKVTATTGKDIAESIKQARISDRTLRTAIDRNYYVGLGKEVFKNSLEDLKSGKFYNKDRADKFFSDMNDETMDMGGDFDFDMGDEDFDMGENDDFSASVDSSDGMAHASISRKKGRNNEVTSIYVGTDLGPDSAIYQATNYQTETMVNVGRAVVDHGNTNARATMMMLGNMRNEITASLTSINDNVSTISSSLSDMISKNSALSAKFYEDSIGLQTQILEAIKAGTGSTQLNTRTFKDYNDVMEMFTTGGAIDAKAYSQLVKKQFDNYVDSNMFLSQIKFMMGEKETLKMLAQNPLSFIPKAITQQLIPNTVKSIITEFDNQMKETGIAALNQISGLQRSQNPILNALGKIFGVQNKITISTLDKGAYNKGPAQWTGVDHQALVNVIPTLLRKIHASVSGSEELAFDYDKGTWGKLRDMEKNFEKDKVARETSMYSEYKSEFKEFLDKTVAASKEDKEKYSKDMETFLQKLARDSYGGRTFRLGGRSGKEAGRDDIRELLGKGSSNDPSVMLIRAYLQGMEKTNNAKLTALFGSKTQEQRAQIDRMMREMQNDPIKYNALYQETGLGTYNQKGHAKPGGMFTDSHLNFDEKATNVTGIAGGVMAGTHDKFGHTQSYYLREILSTLSTGIYVVPLENTTLSGTGGGRRRRRRGQSSDTGVNSNASSASRRTIADIQARADSVTAKFKQDETEKKNKDDKNKPSTTYGEEKRDKDVRNGMIDLTGEFTQDQLNALSSTYQSEMNAQSTPKPGLIGKLLGLLPEGTGAEKLIGNIQKGTSKVSGEITEVFKKMDNILFQIVFGDPNGQKGIHALFSKTVGVLKAGFFKFSTFLDDKILKPLNEALFGENGIFNKIKQTELWKKMSDMFKNLSEKAGQFLLGDKLADGTRVGGIFSETANSLKDMGTSVKTAILGEKGPDGKPLPLDQDHSVVGNLKKMFKGATDSIGKAMGIDTSKPKESIGTRIATGMDAIFSRFSDRAKEFSDNIFGQYDGGSEFFKQFKEDLKGQKGFVGASAVVGAAGTMVLGSHMGLLGSMFLPGGPIGGALLGAGVGIISKSTGLKNYLFGPEVTDEDGNTFRAGGLITKQVQDFFKENKTGIGVGALAGLASSFGLLPALFVPGGPIGGAIIGGAVSMAAKTDAFQRVMYGEGGTKDDPTGGLMGKLKQIFGKNKDMKTLALDVGIGAGIGVLGSFFLPGGPILGAMLGSAASVATATTAFKDWFFGTEGEDGKRTGGVFSRFSDYVKEKVFSPLAKGVQIAQNHMMGFVKKNMVIPFQYAMRPLIEEAKFVAGGVKDAVKGLFSDIKERIHGAVIKPIGDFVDKHFLSPMKKMLGNLFMGIGRVVGSIIAAPFTMLSALGKSAYEGQKKRGIAAYDAEKTKDKGFMGTLFYNMHKRFTQGKARREAAFSEKGAWYEKGQTVERYKRMANEQAAVDADVARRDYEIRNNTKVSKTPAGTINGINLGEFAKRSGMDKNKVLLAIKRGEIKATKHGSGYVVDPNEVTRLRNTRADETKADMVAKAKSVRRHEKNAEKIAKKKAREQARAEAARNAEQSGEATPQEQTETSVVTSTQSTDTSSGDTSSGKRKNKRDKRREKREKRKNSTSVNTNARKGKKKKSGDTEVNKPKNETRVSDTTVSAHTSSSSDDKGDVGKPKRSFYDRIMSDVSKIADSVYGQLNGVGLNVNKIYKILLKKNGLNDEDITGENNKQYVGFFGRIRTALNRPFRAITDAITAPFKKIAEAGHKLIDGIKGIGSSVKKAGKALVEGVGGLVKGLAKGIGSILTELVKLPFDIIHTGLSAVRAALPVVGEIAKAGASVLADSIKVAGSVLVTGVRTVGDVIAGSAKGLGKLLGGAMSGLGSMLGAAGLIGADVLKGAWKGLKFVGAGALKVAGAVASAPFKLLGGLGKGIGGLFNKGVQHVYVDGGVLDRVKKVNKVLSIPKSGGSGGESISRPIKPLPGGFGFFDKVKSKLEEKDEDVVEVHVVAMDEAVIAQIGELFGIKVKPNGKLDTSSVSSGIDTNAGDTSVSTGSTAGGPADDDEDKTDNVGETSLSTSISSSISNLKDSFGAFKDKVIGAKSAISDAFNDKIAKRQAQVDKGSRTSLLSRFAAADKEEKETEFRTKLLSLLGKTSESTEEHKSIFASIFSKKGLITAGILLALPFIIKFFKEFELDKLISGIAGGIAQGLGEVGGLPGVLNNVKEKVDQIMNVIGGEEKTPSIDENGNLEYNEDGTLKMEENTRSRIGALLMPTKTRINTETGKWENRREWTQMSGATANLIGHKVGIPILKGYDNVVKGAKWFANTKVGGKIVKGVKNLAFKASNSTPVVAAYTHVDDAMKAVGKGLKKLPGNMVTGAKNWIQSGKDLNNLAKAGYGELAGQAGLSQKIAGKVTGLASSAKGLADNGLTKIATSAKGLLDDAVAKGGKSEIVATFIKKAGEAIAFLVKKLAEVGGKFGVKLSESAFGKLVSKIMTKVLHEGVLAKFAKKVADFMKSLGTKAATSGSTALIAEIAFVTYGAIDGAVNAGALFEVNPDAVDAKMRAIAAVFKGLLNTTAGSVIDFVNVLCSEILGTNFVKEFATYAYDRLSDAEDQEALKAAQDDFTKGYQDYVAEEYEAYKKSTEAQGQQAMSFEDFKASSLSTTRSEYNSKTNKSLFKRGVDAVQGLGRGIKNLGKGIADGATGLWNGTKNVAKGAWNGIKGIGKGIAEGATGLWNGAKDLGSKAVTGVKNFGKNAVEGAKNLWTNTKTAVGNAWTGVKNSAVGKAVGTGIDNVKNFASGVVDKGKEIFNKAGDAISKLSSQGKEAATGLMTGWANISKTFYDRSNSFLDYFKADVNPLGEENMFHGVVGGVLGASKFVLFPVLLVKGILGKVGKFVVDGVTKVIDGAKTAGGDFMTNGAEINKLALAGDVQGLGNYQVTMSPNNPISGVTGGLLGITRILNYPIAYLSKGIQFLVNGVKSVIDGAKKAGADFATNGAAINKLAFAGDLQGLSNYQIVTSPNNPIGGLTSGVLGLTRILNYPIALVSLGAQKVASGVKAVIDGAKTAGTDFITNTQDIARIALSGDINGLGNYQIVTSPNNPVSGFTSGMIGGVRLLGYPIALVAKGADLVATTVRNVIDGAKVAIGDFGTNIAGIGQLALAGDLNGLSSYQVTTSPNNPVSGFTSGMVGIARVLSFPIAALSAGGHAVVNGVKSGIAFVKTSGEQVVSNSKTLFDLAIKGDVSGLHGHQGVDENGNPVGGFVNAVLGAEKFVLSPLANVISAGKALATAVKTGIDKTIDYGKQAGTFVSKLNEYTNPDKSMGSWDSESMTNDPNDVVGSVLSTIIKKVMWIYVGIVRTVKGAFKWVENVGDAVATGAQNAWNGATNLAQNAWNGVTGAVDSAGTWLMNLGRGGTSGGRPLNRASGGKGGSGEELNGMPYYSQNDPKYKNVQYKQTGGQGGSDTLGESGCGPTAMAMVASKFTGKDYNPTTMAKMSEAGGYSTSLGTTPGYFSAAGNALGIPNRQEYPSADRLQDSLANGNAVVLQGASGGKGGLVNTPYTKEGHYVTATGIDGAGNVIINDPRGKQYSGAYRMSDVMSGTTGMWSFGGEDQAQTGGYGTRSKLRGVMKGGRGPVSASAMMSDGSGIPSTSKKSTGMSDYDRWIQICRAVKKAYADKKLGYSQSRYTDITVGGRTIKGRTDCSGYVQTCLKFFGVMNEGTNISSANVQNPGDSTMKATKFTPYNWPGWENLKEGDVLGRTGHTEIFAYNQGGTHYVYNCGSDSSNNNPNPTPASNKPHQTIWRCGAAGDGALSSFAVTGGGATYGGDTSGGFYSGGDSYGASSSSSGGFSNLASLLGGLADAAITPIYKALGFNVGDDSTSSGVSTGGYDASGAPTGGSSVTGVASADGVKGSDTAQKVWNYFTGLGYSKAAVAGILGNMQQESGVNPASIQGNGKGPAAGIVQWENYNTKSSRWKEMSDYAASKGKPWTDLASQLEFIHYELPRLGSFWKYQPNMAKAGTTATTYDAWKASTSIDTATRQFEGAFERAGKPAMDNRIAAANKFYNLYANSSTSSTVAKNTGTGAKPMAAAMGGKGGKGGGKPSKSPMKLIPQSLQKRRPISGGKGEVTSTPMSLQSTNSSFDAIVSRNKVTGAVDSNNMLQLFKVAIEYLSQIVTNTGEANSELEALNQKEFGNITQTNTTNNITDNSMKAVNGEKNDTRIPNRSDYALAKRIAAGILE